MLPGDHIIAGGLARLGRHDQRARWSRDPGILLTKRHANCIVTERLVWVSGTPRNRKGGHSLAARARAVQAEAPVFGAAMSPVANATA
jgi:hypothetical protein